MSQLSKLIDWVKISKCLGLLMSTIVMKSDLKEEKSTFLMKNDMITKGGLMDAVFYINCSHLLVL